MSRARGFTLLEVLLALAIVAVVLVAAHLVVVSTLGASDRLQRVGEPVASAHSLGWLLREDLRGVVSGELLAGALQGAGAEERSPGGDLFSLVTTSDPRQEGEVPGPRLVSYRVRPNPEDPRLLDLYRSGTPWSRGSAQAGPEERAYEPVFRGLRSIEIEYFTGSEWRGDWPPGPALPAAVRIRLGVPVSSYGSAGEAERTQRYELVVWLPTGGSAGQPQGAAGEGGER